MNKAPFFIAVSIIVLCFAGGCSGSKEPSIPYGDYECTDSSVTETICFQKDSVKWGDTSGSQYRKAYAQAMLVQENQERNENGLKKYMGEELEEQLARYEENAPDMSIYSERELSYTSEYYEEEGYIYFFCTDENGDKIPGLSGFYDIENGILNLAEGEYKLNDNGK